MLILIRSRIILSLAVINICPMVKFIAHTVIHLKQHYASLSLSLSVFPLLSYLPTVFCSI